MRARQDPNKTPAQRNLEAVTTFLTRLGPEAQKRVDRAEPRKRQEVLTQEQDRQWAMLVGHLNLAGLSLADIFNGEAIVRLRNSQAVQQAIDAAGKTPAERLAMRRMIDAYIARDLAALARIADEDNGAEAQMKQMNARLKKRALDERNARMVERMQPQLKAGRAFVAIGALHLYGERSVLGLLEGRGYKVSSVY